MMWLWWRFFYRPTMKLLHRFHLHYAPPIGPIDEGDGTFRMQLWCKWCGFRMNLPKGTKFL